MQCAAGNQEAANSLLSASGKIQNVVMRKCLSEFNAVRRLGNLAARTALVLLKLEKSLQNKW